MSVRDCTGAQLIEVTEGQTVTGKDFQLDTGATISGTVYQSDGVTPLIGKNCLVSAYIGSPCGSSYVGSATVNSANGAYTIEGLSAGSYYLQTSSTDNYFSEWWASPVSVRDCVGAQAITVAEKQTVINKNFQLDPSSSISGTVYQSDGETPVICKSILAQVRHF